MHPFTFRMPRLSVGVAVVALLLALALVAARALAAPPGPAELDLIVVTVQGEVSVSTQGTRHAVHQGEVVSLPATIYTGPTGSIELRQGKTTLSAAPNSELSFPVPSVAGEALDHIDQLRGSAFYSVAKREARKLHVETAYLVAVVKGTQFSVVAQDDSTTISLFEGVLEVRATDYSDVVELDAGEIAIRHAGDSAIRLLRMDTGEPMARTGGGSVLGTSADAGSAAGSETAPPAPASQPGAAAVVTTVDTGSRVLDPGDSAIAPPAVMHAETNLSGLDTTVAGGVSAGNGSASVTSGVAANLGGVSTTASTGVSVAPGAAGVGATVNAAVGNTSSSVGLTAGVTPAGVAVGITAAAATPAASAAAGVTAATGPAGLTAGATTSIAAPVTATAAVGSGSLGVAVNTPVTGSTAINLGTTAAPTSPAANVTPSTGTASSTPATNPTTNPVGGLIGNAPSPIKNLLGH